MLTQSTPTDPDIQAKVDTLTDRAFEILLKNLEGYGNRPNKAHQEALRSILKLFSSLAFGVTSGRFAVPLPTGAGKTQSIVAFLAALNHPEYEDISVAVCASQVEALCDLKRSLYWQDVPDDRVGIWHSYAFDESMAQQYHSGKREDLEKGYASLPATTDHTSKQILLVTHNRLRGKEGINEYNTYNGKPRNLLIWDESLFLSDCFALEMSDLQGAKDWLGHKHGGKYEPLLNHLNRCLGILEDGTTHQTEDGKPQISTMPTLTVDQLDSFKAVLPRGAYGEVINRFLDMSQNPLRHFKGMEESLLAYIPVIHDGLKNIVVLDASNSIRKLCALNRSRIKKPFRVKYREMVSYEAVKIHQLHYASGRNKLEKKYTADLDQKDEGVLKEVVEVIRNIPPEEAILVFTFKQQQSGHDHIQALNKSLRRNDINTDQIIEVQESYWERDQKKTRSVPKRRINFLTWGNECSLNRLSYCSNVILAGILHRKEDDLASYVVGEKDDLKAELDKKELIEIRTSEVCHCIYQSLSRGSCRIIKDGKAGAMNVWLIHKYDDIRKTINEVLPQVIWTEWVPTYLVSESKYESIVQMIVAFLDGLPPGDDKVSSIRLKRELDLKGVPETSFTNVVKEAAKRSSGWVYTGRSLSRGASLFSSEK